jgi:hypothetical protein
MNLLLPFLFLLIPFTSRDSDPRYSRIDLSSADEPPRFDASDPEQPDSADPEGSDTSDTPEPAGPFSEHGPMDPDTVFKHFGENYYGVGTDYWSTQALTYMAMTGRASVHRPDVEFSRKVLERYVRSEGLNPGLCADVGCGIGRVSKMVLSEFFKNITLIEPIERFLNKAEVDLTRSGVTVRTIQTTA